MENQLGLNAIHHIAIICSDYEISKKFYTEILGFNIVREVYREERESYKLDLALENLYQIELFSFPSPSKRPSRPESCGLRHLAFSVNCIANAKEKLEQFGILVEPIRTDPYTNKKYTFFQDPDYLPIELYES